MADQPKTRDELKADMAKLDKAIGLLEESVVKLKAEMWRLLAIHP